MVVFPPFDVSRTLPVYEPLDSPFRSTLTIKVFRDSNADNQVAP